MFFVRSFCLVWPFTYVNLWLLWTKVRLSRDQFPYQSVRRLGKSCPALWKKSKATVFPFPRSENLNDEKTTSICKVNADKVASDVRVNVFLLYVAACFRDKNSKFKLVVNSMYFGDGKMELFGLVGQRSPGLHEDHWLFWYLGSSHLNHML